MQSFHPADDDLERYYLGMVKDHIELTILEEHLISCPDCVDQAEAVQYYIDEIRIAVLRIHQPPARRYDSPIGLHLTNRPLAASGRGAEDPTELGGSSAAPAALAFTWRHSQILR